MANALIQLSGFGGGGLATYGDPATPFTLSRVIASAPGVAVSIDWIAAFGLALIAPPAAGAILTAPLQVFRYLAVGPNGQDAAAPNANNNAATNRPEFYYENPSDQSLQVPNGFEEIYSNIITLENTHEPFTFPGGLRAQDGQRLYVVLGAATDRSPAATGARVVAAMSLSVGGRSFPARDIDSVTRRSLPRFDI